MYAYRLNGLRLASDIELPALDAWDQAAFDAADVVYRLDKVAQRLDCPDHVAPIFQTRGVFQTKGVSEYLLSLPGTGRILSRGGTEVMFEPDARADITVLSAVLTGSIQAVLWHQRGLLPLHASGIVAGDGAVALCGHSSSGKSTLAAFLARQGCAVAADDICLVDSRAGGEISLLPGSGRLRLSRDALDGLGIATQGLRQALAGREQYFLDCRRLPPGPIKLAALLILSRRTGNRAAIERQRGPLLVEALHKVVRMRRPAHALGRSPDIFAALMRLVTIPVWRLNIPEGPAGLHEAAANVLSVLDA